MATKALSKNELRKRERWQNREIIETHPEVREEIREKIRPIENAAVQVLSGKELEVFFLRFKLSGNGAHSKEEVSLILNISVEEVGRIERAAIRKVKRHLAQPPQKGKVLRFLQ